ncbi:MAG: hypothetical protein ACRDHZ_20255, partial [Ktedonobacteraceae bacterium]
LQSVVGGLVLAIGEAIWQHIKQGSVDWIAISGLFIISCAVFLVFLTWFRPKILTSEVEHIVEKYLSKKGTVPDAPTQSSVVVSSAPEAVVASPQFDGEIYRIVTAAKHPYAEMTREVIKMMGPEKHFEIDVDVLVEMYVVNISDTTQYVRDIIGSVEIDGTRMPLLRQRDFDAWEFSGGDYEYCLDPTPEESKILISSRVENLDVLAPVLPCRLEPKSPLNGWIHFLLQNIDPEKLKDNQTYQFSIMDSVGQEHPISRPARRRGRGGIEVRKK